MSELKKQVQAWIEAGKDYDEGMVLLSRNSKNKTLVRILSMNPNPSKADKLLYELTKLADMKDDYASQSAIINPPSLRPRAERRGSNPPKKKKEKPVLLSPSKLEPEVKEIKHVKPFNKLPLIIQELIKQKGNLYRTREQLHAKITDENQLNNKPENMKKRKPILEKIDRISKRIDELYEAEIAFKEKGVLPTEDLLDWNEEPDNEVKKNIPDPAKLSDLDLKNRLTNLKTYLTKDTNQLKFQAKSSQAKENPMPAGPKREKLERKITACKYEMEAIEAELKKRAGKH